MYYTTTTQPYSSADVTAFGAGILAFLGIMLLVAAATSIFYMIVCWKVFKKAGKPGWAAIVPVYNMIILFEVIGYKWQYIFLLFLSVVPYVGTILVALFAITYNIKLAKSFGQSVGFGIGLWLLPPIFMAIIAFNKNINYVGPAVKGDIDFNDLF